MSLRIGIIRVIMTTMMIMIMIMIIIIIINIIRDL